MKNLLMFVLIGVALAQEPKKPELVPVKDESIPSLSAEDKFQGRTMQWATMTALNNLKDTPQYKSLEAAQANQQQFFAGLYTKYKLDSTKVSICDGPAPGECEKVPQGEIQIVKKKEAKK
jgi:hypothetical protein